MIIRGNEIFQWPNWKIILRNMLMGGMMAGRIAGVCILWGPASHPAVKTICNQAKGRPADQAISIMLSGARVHRLIDWDLADPKMQFMQHDRGTFCRGFDKGLYLGQFPVKTQLVPRHLRRNNFLQAVSVCGASPLKGKFQHRLEQLDRFGIMLTSMNLHGRPSITDPEEAIAQLKEFNTRVFVDVQEDADNIVGSYPVVCHVGASHIVRAAHGLTLDHLWKLYDV